MFSREVPHVHAWLAAIIGKLVVGFRRNFVHSSLKNYVEYLLRWHFTVVTKVCNISADIITIVSIIVQR